MKKVFKRLLILTTILLIVAAGLYLVLQPLWELGKLPAYKGSINFKWQYKLQDSSKKNIIIIADNDGTEMFDLMSPFYLFNATQKANVYVISEFKAPIVLAKGVFILPQLSFSEVDSLKIKPDVIVIPNQSRRVSESQKPATVKWIKDHYLPSTIILSICDGSATAAATGIYNGKALTTHSSDLDELKKKYPKPIWLKNISVTNSGNLYSTAGVSNATEGSLVVINKLFGSEVMKMVKNEVHYPHEEIKMDHKSYVLNFAAICIGIKKIVFEKNKRIGVLLQNNMNEFELASLLDCYVRTAPASIQTIVSNGTSVISKYGLTLLPTNNFNKLNFDEIHVLMPEVFKEKDEALFRNCAIIKYDQFPEYPIDLHLKRIKNLYGSKFQNMVKLMLDYN
ncbi:MAG: DJ-1/PfpI family protein [Flavisolibacter sp.]